MRYTLTKLGRQVFWLCLFTIVLAVLFAVPCSMYYSKHQELSHTFDTVMAQRNTIQTFKKLRNSHHFLLDQEISAGIVRRTEKNPYLRTYYIDRDISGEAHFEMLVRELIRVDGVAEIRQGVDRYSIIVVRSPLIKWETVEPAVITILQVTRRGLWGWEGVESR